jgi:hypothetical protein
MAWLGKEAGRAVCRSEWTGGKLTFGPAEVRRNSDGLGVIRKL